MGSVSITLINLRLSFKMQSMIVLAMCVTVTIGDYVLPGIGIVGRYPARPPPMRPIEDDSENETGRWQWIPPEEVGDDSDIEEIPDLIFPGNTEEIPEALPVVTGNNEEIPGDLSLFIGSSEEFPEAVPFFTGSTEEILEAIPILTGSTEEIPEALPLKGSTEEILEVLPLSSKRRRRYAATASTEGRRRRAPTSSTEGRRRRSAAFTSSTGGRRRRSAATSSSTKATERRRRREVTSTEECCDSKKYVCEVGQPLC